MFSGKLVDELNNNNNNNNSHNNNGIVNNKWVSGSSCNSLLHGNKLNLHASGLQNHHHSTHHHAAVAAAAMASPFSSLLSAGGSAGYLLDPLHGLNKPTTTPTANPLF